MNDALVDRIEETLRQLKDRVDDISTRMATRDDLKACATRDDLKAFATRDDLQAFATRDDLQAFATRDDLQAFATRDDLQAFATRDDLQAFATHEDLKAGFDKAFEQTQGGFEAHRRFMELTVTHHVGALRTEMNERFDKVDVRFDTIESRFDRLETLVTGRPRPSRHRPRRRR